MFARICRVALMIGLTAAFVLAWLPLMRGLLDGDSYEWGLTLFGHAFSGSGLNGDYWFVSAEAALGVIMMALGWRAPGAVFKLLSVAFTGTMLADSLFTLFVLGEGQTFEGATLGMSLSAGMIFLGVYGLLFVLASVWAFAGRPGPAPRWTLVNSGLLTLALLLAPGQYLLLSTGQGRELSDQIGVLITMSQWLLISLAFAPWGGPDRPRLSPA
ncbi:MAG: hypothetical protein K1X35_10170 [Caulobacteraceae bacterium]|nr:hypothetical protein [Caulobacteraceae bacterium]